MTEGNSPSASHLTRHLPLYRTMDDTVAGRWKHLQQRFCGDREGKIKLYFHTNTHKYLKNEETRTKIRTKILFNLKKNNTGRWLQALTQHIYRSEVSRRVKQETLICPVDTNPGGTSRRKQPCSSWLFILVPWTPGERSKVRSQHKVCQPSWNDDRKRRSSVCSVAANNMEK